MPSDDLIGLLSRADELYRNRARGGAVKESVSLLAGATAGAGRYEVQWRLARSLFFLGQEADSSGSRRQLHAAGIGAGDRASRLNDQRVEGHFWLGVNLALFAEAAGGLKAARALLRARSELLRAASISEAYHGAGPLRVLARLEHKAPRLLGGSRKRSLEYLDRALEIEPQNSVTRVYAAELLIDRGERGRALQLLEGLAAAPIDAGWEFENRRDREKALSMIARLRGS